LYLACDKGNCQKGINAFVKYLFWWDKDKKRVLTHMLDINAADNKSYDAASAIDTSLRKIDRPETKRKLAGHGSDAGRGGTGTSLYVCLKQKDRAEEYYLIATCSLHGWQRVLGNAIEGCSGGGGMYKRDMLQMLHTAFQIQEEFEIPEFKSMWHFVDGQEMEKMVKPDIGRWGSVGQAGATFLENWDGWHEMSQSIVSSFNTDVNANTLALWLNTYNMRDPGLKAQVIFVVNFHHLVWDKHFQ
jgi:hypothetical protein